MKKLLLWIAAVLLLCCGTAKAEFRAAEHPCILWTKADAEAIKARIDKEPWAKDAVKALPNNTFGKLFRYQVLGDQKAGDEERKYLLSFIGAPLNGMSDVGGDAGLHTANYLHALRYDVLYESLAPDQRQKLEETFRKHIAEDIAYWKSNPARFGILPNLALPRRCGTLMMSLALQDEKTIRDLWAAPGSFKWFFGEYLSDGQFYNEEFAKMTSIIGEFLIYARGLDRLGLAELGYDYKGPTGGSLERYVHSLMMIGYPRTEILSGAPAYTRIAMGDARGGQLLQQFIVDPYWPDGKGGPSNWYAANMNGRDHRGTKVEKLQLPQWFEILQTRYPKGDAGYDYFLAQMHKPGEDTYFPTLFWGLEPINVRSVKAPPAPSYVALERGFAMLRSDESPRYWESSAPAVAQQFAQFYVHYTDDCFSLLGYYQFNCPIYSNRAISAGYNGGPWDMTVRGHCGVVVDAEMAQPIGVVPVRSDFSGPVKFVSARGIPIVPLTGQNEARSSDQPRDAVSRVYSNIDLSRSLFLAPEYLFDVYALADVTGTARNFHWLVHAPGVAIPESGQSWQPSDDLQKSLFATPYQQPLQDRSSLPPAQRLYHLMTEGTQGPPWVVIDNCRKLTVDDQPFSITTRQDYRGEDVTKSRFGATWYERKIGVRVSFLPEPATTTYTFDTPQRYAPGAPRTEDDKGRRALGAEWGGVSIDVHRHTSSTIFAALHEPYKSGVPNQSQFRRIQQNADGIAAAVSGRTSEGKEFDDRLLLQFDRRAEGMVKKIPQLEDDASGTPVTLADSQESFTFRGHAMVRSSPATIVITGELLALKLKVTGAPKVTINGKPASVRIVGGTLYYP